MARERQLAVNKRESLIFIVCLSMDLSIRYLLWRQDGTRREIGGKQKGMIDIHSLPINGFVNKISLVAARWREKGNWR